MMKLTILILTIFLISTSNTDQQTKIFKQQSAPYLISAVNKHNGRHFNTGSIINERWVLIAAHTVYLFVQFPSNMEVVVRTKHELNEGDRYDVEKVIVHKGWNIFNWQDDIALLKLSSPIIFNEEVQPIPIGIQKVEAGVDVDLVAYGYDPDDFYFHNLKTVSNEQCAEDYPLQLISKNQMCTSTRYGQIPCFTDSTGPLINNGTQVGIFSYHYICSDEKPYILTRLSQYLDWIDTNMKLFK